MPVLSPRYRHPQSENIPPGQMEPDERPSPSTSRAVPVFSPVQLNSKNDALTQGNDDAAELKARRRSRVLEIQRKRLASSPVSEADRSRTTPLSTLTNAQVAEHYRNCIKLSAENKINAKNAFGLHLIDYMSELIKKKEMNNFQVASSTLDASAKIYAGRVDAIHSDMYKVLGGLGQQKKEEEEGEGEEQPAGSDKGSPRSQEEKKRKRKRPAKKIKANVNTITMNSYNLEFEVDPLFKKTSASFDEGGTKGLLLNNLPCGDNQSELVLDSEHVVIDLSSQREQQSKVKVPLKVRKGSLQKMTHTAVCAAFSDFTFTNWNAENEGIFKSLLEKDRCEHAFDADAEPEPIPMLEGGDGEMDYDNLDVGHDSDNDSVTDDRIQDYQHVDKDAQLVNTVMESIKHGNIGELMHVLASEQNDYSHFNSSVLNTWAGPSLWKMKAGALIKSKLAPNADNEQNDAKSKRKRRAPFKIDLDSGADPSTMLKESRAATEVKESTLSEYSKSQTTLPADLRLQADELFKRGLKDGIMLRRKRSCQDVEDGVGDYDYENTNDANNFCTAVNDDDDDDGGLPCTQDSQDSEPHEFQITQDLDNTANRTMGDLNMTSTGANLSMVEQPRRVQRIEIDYAKTAKKIDVKKLKSSMWQLLCNAEKKDEDKAPPAPGEPTPSTSHMEGQLKFSDLVVKLPEKVSSTMAKNLSAPICFVSLLHLANEKKLSIKGEDDLSDLTITQG